MKQKDSSKEEDLNLEDSEEFKRSGRTLKGFKERCDSADAIEFIGVDPDAPF